MSDSRPASHRSRFQVSLKMLFMLTFSVAVYLAGYTSAIRTDTAILKAEREARQQAEEARQQAEHAHGILSVSLETMEADLKSARAEAAFREHREFVYSRLELVQAKHRTALDPLRQMQVDRSRVVCRYIRSSTDGEEQEVLLFHEPAGGTPDNVTSVALLLGHRKRQRFAATTETRIVDIVSRTFDSPSEDHDSELTDADNDGQLDLVIHRRPGYSNLSFGPSQLVYKITDQGFVLEEMSASK